jgi:hypothetical protein
MARNSWTSLAAHNDNTQFRAWGAELNAKLTAMGLTQTADTGQINWATVTKAAINSEAGYEIWRFNDALQATAPIFIRIGYGTGANILNPRIQIIFGNTSNGAGLVQFNGVTGASRDVASGAQSDTIGRQSFVSYKPERGFFGLSWKVGATCQGEFFIARTVDTNGDPTDTGVLVAWSNANGQQYFRYASPGPTATTFVSGCKSCLIPQEATNSIVTSGEPQVYTHFVSDPRVNPINQVLTVFESEFGQGTTFQATIVGVTPRTYIVTNGPMSADAVKGTGTVSIAYIWET